MFLKKISHSFSQYVASYFKNTLSTYRLLGSYFEWRAENKSRLILFSLLLAGNIAKALILFLSTMAVSYYSVMLGAPIVGNLILFRITANFLAAHIVSASCTYFNAKIAGKLKHSLKQRLEEITSKWLDSGAFYISSTLLLDKNIKSESAREIRIAEVLPKSIEKVSEHAVDLVNSFVDVFFSFCVGTIGLCQIQTSFEFVIGTTAIVIPGSMLIMAVVYSEFLRFAINTYSSKLREVVSESEKHEIEKQARLKHIESHAEQLQMSGMIKAEQAKLTRAHLEADKYSQSELQLVAKLSFLGEFNAKFRTVAGLLFNIPALIAKRVAIDTVYLINGYFSNVVSFFSWKHDNFNKLTSMELAAKNIENIHDMIKKCQQVSENKKIRIARNNDFVSLRNLVIKSPEGHVLLKVEDLTFKEGITLIQGGSGSGKTTLFRTLAGTWPHGEGELSLPDENAVHFVSQKPVFPLKANLYDAIFHEEVSASSSQMKEKMMMLWKHFFKEKNPLTEQEWLVERDWSKRLSVGEQRILVLIRAILKQPKVLFMDEPFAGLDKRKCERAIDFLRQYLPADCKIIYIDHALEANSFCDNLLELKDGSLWCSVPLVSKTLFLNMHKTNKTTLSHSVPLHSVEEQNLPVKPIVTQLVSSCG